MMSQCSCDFIRNCSKAKVETTSECLGTVNIPTLLRTLDFKFKFLKNFRILASRNQYVHHKEIIANS